MKKQSFESQTLLQLQDGAGHQKRDQHKTVQSMVSPIRKEQFSKTSVSPMLLFRHTPSPLREESN